MSSDWIADESLEPSKEAMSIATGMYGPVLVHSRRNLALCIDRRVGEEIVKYNDHVRATIAQLSGVFVEWEDKDGKQAVAVDDHVVAALLQCFPALELK